MMLRVRETCVSFQQITFWSFIVATEVMLGMLVQNFPVFFPGGIILFGVILLILFNKPIIGYMLVIPFLPNYGIDIFNITGSADISLLEPALVVGLLSWAFLTIREKKLEFYMLLF